MTPRQRRLWRLYVIARTHDDLTDADRLVLVMLAEYTNFKYGTNARPGVAKLAKDCGITPRRVLSAFRRARDLKLIAQTARANPKAGRAAVHRLLPAPDF
jgi:hypothetical protein